MTTDSARPPLILVNVVGLTSRLLAHSKTLARIAREGSAVPLKEVTPAVTSTVQATFLTGKLPQDHGIVANGWLFRGTMEVRFWQQSNRLLQAEPLYVTARRLAEQRNRKFRCAKLFWWFNQGADVDISVTPKPHYGADGNKVFGITGAPEQLADKLERKLGPFPFPAFWGPMAGIASTEWIAKCAAEILTTEVPNLTLVYLPHLDYDPQRFGTGDWPLVRTVVQLDQAVAPILDVAKQIGARVWFVSEYGHCDVSAPVFLNRELRRRNLLSVRSGPFGEMVDTFASRAIAVCDHQLAHVFVRDPADIPHVRDMLQSVDGVARIYAGDEREQLSLLHPRSGELVVLSEPDRWFAYPYWLDDQFAPDFARTVDIHRKIGFDPCEMFFEPKLVWPKGRAIRRLIQKKLGFRTLFDVIPLDANIVRGSHGLPAPHREDQPLLITDHPHPQLANHPDPLPMTSLRDLILEQLF